jgi:RNA-directed DNA polymerase
MSNQGTQPTGSQPPRGFFAWLRRLLFGDPVTPSASAPSESSGRTVPPTPGNPAQASGKVTGSGAASGVAAGSLEASQFLPITRDEILSATRGRWFWSSAFWGRRDLIPPSADRRTHIIDRGMLTQGLLTAEQLAEIHRVGLEMDAVRPSIEAIQAAASNAGDAAVLASREERKRIRDEKKAAAAQRREQRARDVARRFATDIVYLGRGVSGRLGERTSDVPKLEAAALPILHTPADIASAMGLTIPQLRGLAFHSEVTSRSHYIQFSVPKKSGGMRQLSAPHRRMAQCQQWIHTQILSRLDVSDQAHGFVVARSTVTNAAPHCGKAVVLNTDLEGFFPSITFPRVRKVFIKIGYSPAVATILALLCTECPRRQVEFGGKLLFVATGPRALPQGACTSPALSNQVARRLDRRLQGLSVRLGLTYTRYADDITISGNDELKTRTGYVMARIRHLAQDEGFRVNEAKTRVQRQNTAQSVTGLVVNETPGVCRSKIRRIRAILHQARQTGLESQNRDRHPNFKAWVEGMIAYIAMSRPETAAKLRHQLEKIREN